MMNRARSHSTDAAAAGRRSTTRRPEKGHRRCATSSSAVFLQLSRNERPLGGSAADAVEDDALLVGRSAMGGVGVDLMDDQDEQNKNCCNNKTAAATAAEVETPSPPSQLDKSIHEDDTSDNSGDEQRASQQQQQQQHPKNHPHAAGDSSLPDKNLSTSLPVKKSSSTRRSLGVGNSLRRVFVKQQQETARPAASESLATNIKSNDPDKSEQESGPPVPPVSSDDFSIDANEPKEEHEDDNDEEPTKIYNTPRLMDSFRLESLRENRHRGDPWFVGLLFAWMRHWYDVWCGLTRGFGWVTWSLLLVVTLVQPVLTLVVLPVAALVLRYGRRIATQAAAGLPTTTREAALLWRWLRQTLRERWNAFVTGAQRGQAVFALAMVLRYLRGPQARNENHQHQHRHRRD